MGLDHYRNGLEVTLHRDLIDAPLHWKRPRHLSALEVEADFGRMLLLIGLTYRGRIQRGDI
jgi:hypothetical protein